LSKSGSSSPKFISRLVDYKSSKKATQLKSVHAWLDLFGSNFIGTINFIAKFLDSGTNGKRKWLAWLQRPFVPPIDSLLNAESNKSRQNHPPRYCGRAE
jgi:hypothetical protein